ncbi:MAG TPA: CHAD domain-containing protein [Candidatus Limnocylindrales bacterium]|nr:CHAD domain-containing protein [Candidatus Limnocylindrales bacterium]
MTPTNAAPMEIELKYRMTGPTAGEHLLAADDLAGFGAVSDAETVHNDDRYVDTPDGALAAAGYAGRFRTQGDDTIITLKGLRRQDDGGAVQRREELEGPADLSAAAGAWPESAAREAVLTIVGAATLEELVRVRQVRRKRNYAAAGTVVELSVDDVEVVVGDRVIERFAELEVELREGDEAALQPLVDLLAEVEELMPAETSKLERAMDAVRRERAGEGGSEAGADDDDDVVEGTATEAEAATKGDGPVGDTAPQAAADASLEPAPEPRLPVSKSPGVVADDHLAEAGRKVVRFHLARMLAREPGARAGTETEELHGMRVATRRQRAAWRVFGDAFDTERTDRYRRRLKLVAADLGGVRDLDVLIEAGEAYQARQAAGEGQAFEPLLRAWRTQRDAARAVLVKELDSKAYRKWLDAYVDFAQSEGLGARPVGPVDPHRVRDTMPSRIWAAYEVVRAYEPVMRWADVTTLHDLRIAAKWLRYTLEFVREALGRDAGPVIEKVVALQDHLGWLHDADVAANLARAFLVEHAGTLSEAESAAIGRYLVDRERELARLRRTVGPPWRGVASLAFRRALGRVVAGL